MGRNKFSLRRSSGFVYAYGWNVYYQKLLGIWPVEGESPIARQRAWVLAFLVFVSVWIPQLLSMPLLWGELNRISNCLSTNLSIFVSIAKIIVLQCHRRATGWILVTIAEDWTALKSKKDFDAMMQTARMSHFNSKLSFLFSTVGVSMMILCEMWITLKHERDPNLDPRLARGFTFDSYFPFDTTKLITFVPTWLIQNVSIYGASFAYTGSDSFISMAVLHLCGQLRIIRNSLKVLVNETTLGEPQKYWQRLAAIVTRHEQINQRACLLNVTFSSLLLVQMVMYSLTFCFQGFSMLASITEGDMPNFFHNLLYIIYIILHHFIYCYVGEKLSIESTNISDDFYDTAWYDLRPKEAISFIHVCHRASIPLELRAGKFCTFNMELFNAVIKSSMGYFSMLIALKDKM